MTVSFRPLSDRILVKPDVAEERVGRIIIPDAAKEKPARGVIVAMGPGVLHKNGGRMPMPDVRPGDRVYYSKYSGTEIKLDGAQHLVMREDDVMAVVEP
jgi:chaperonin GroES